MNSERKRLEAALNLQEQHEGATENLNLVRLFLSCCLSGSQWRAFVTKRDGLRYGKRNYEVHPFYYPTQELLKLKEVLCQQKHS